MVFSLFIATTLRIFFVIISYGCKVPAGIFVPSMAIGASFGRMIGILVQWLYEVFPDSRFFSACQPDVPCITPGTYAFLGAGAALSGIMHITISVTVIMFELTGALTYILPTMIVVGITKAVGGRFSKGGIADRMIWFNGFPFLDNKEDHSFGVTISHVMTSNLTILPASDFHVRAVEKLLEDTNFSGFPIVENMQSKMLLGYIGRTELRFAIDRARRQGLMSSTAKCAFTPHASTVEAQIPTDTINPPVTFDGIANSAGQQVVDLSQFVDTTPITVHPRLALETVMELFKKMGPRVILVEHRGQLTGLVTIKDCLKYQFKVEAQENHHHHLRDEQQQPANPSSERSQDKSGKLPDVMQRAGEWVADRLFSLSSGRLKLSPRTATSSHNGWMRRKRGVAVPTSSSLVDNPGHTLNDEDEHEYEHDILDGTEDVDNTSVGVELENR